MTALSPGVIVLAPYLGGTTFPGLPTSLTVWSVSGGRTIVFSMVFITSFHSSFNTRFRTVFSQILANRVRLGVRLRSLRGTTQAPSLHTQAWPGRVTTHDVYKESRQKGFGGKPGLHGEGEGYEVLKVDTQGCLNMEEHCGQSSSLPLGGWRPEDTGAEVMAKDRDSMGKRANEE